MLKMKNALLLLAFVVTLSLSTFGQEPAREKAKATDQDKNAAIPTDTYLKRGAPVGTAKKVSLAKVLAAPDKFAGRTVRVEGVIVRSCKTEGCWAELAPEKDTTRSVRVKMKDHAFFIPLQSAGSLARAEGVFTVKTIGKAEVDHMIADDGAKFDKRNPDGSVTEVSFEASGIELRKPEGK